MKLLLTSAGITNDRLAEALTTLVAKPEKDTKIGFITTAANAEPGNKDWFLRQLTNLYKFGFEWIDLIDISAPDVKWQGRLKDVDVIMMSGGNTFHLLNQVRNSGFDEWLKQNLDSKVYVGISAGSILMSPTIEVATIEPADDNFLNLTDLKALGYVNFEISPHTPEHITHDSNKAYKAKRQSDLYGIDDNSALQVVDGAVVPISDGEWVKY